MVKAALRKWVVGLRRLLSYVSLWAEAAMSLRLSLDWSARMGPYPVGFQRNPCSVAGVVLTTGLFWRQALAQLIFFALGLFSPDLSVLLAEEIPKVTQPARESRAFRDCPECPEMVVIPLGKFLMGATEADNTPDGWQPTKDTPGGKIFLRALASERPRHEVTIAHAFALGKYDVTFAEWEACAADGGCVDARRWSYAAGWGEVDRPITHVSWEKAQAYVAWLNHKTKGTIAAIGTYHLPSEAEWEYAARAGTTNVRYWGDGIGKNQANCRLCLSRWDNRYEASPVGSFAPNQFGLFDILGNVEQWVQDCWHPNYDGAPVDGSPWVTEHCLQHVRRGGSFDSLALDIRAASRINGPPNFSNDSLGFRVARTLP